MVVPIVGKRRKRIGQNKRKIGGDFMDFSDEPVASGGATSHGKVGKREVKRV